MKILVANIGSTSFKYRLVDTAQQEALAQGSVERIGQPDADCPDYNAAISRCLRELAGEGRPLGDLSELGAVGFKAVHAGPLTGARLVDAEVLQAMTEFAFFAPAHNPPYVAAVLAFGQMLPRLPLVVVLETTFFEQLDESTCTYAVPYAWKQEHGVRRYGFHGASHRSASERAQRILGRTDLRQVSCHLGGSSSLAAIRHGVAVDTSFGISPQSGLPQNHRVGDLDVFAALYVMQQRGLTVEQMAEVLATQSGLAGISGSSGDIRDLSQAAAAGDPRARLALDVFVDRVRHYLGAFLVKLGGIDVLTFAGGIGENSAAVRAAVCRDLSGLGIELDAEQNCQLRGEGSISRSSSSVAVLVLPADEEALVARETARVVTASSSEARA
jgi:acetate kinase